MKKNVTSFSEKRGQGSLVVIRIVVYKLSRVQALVLLHQLVDLFKLKETEGLNNAYHVQSSLATLL